MQPMCASAATMRDDAVGVPQDLNVDLSVDLDVDLTPHVPSSASEEL